MPTFVVMHFFFNFLENVFQTVTQNHMKIYFSDVDHFKNLY